MGQDTQDVVWDMACLCSLLSVASGGKMCRGNSRSWGCTHLRLIHSQVWLLGWEDSKAVDRRPLQTGMLILLGFLICISELQKQKFHQMRQKLLDLLNPISEIIASLLFFFLSYLLFNWGIIAFQNYAVFCQTSTWISHHSLTSDALCWSKPLSNSSKFNSPNSIELCPNSKGGDTDLSKNLQPWFEITILYFCRGRRINTRCLSNLPKVIELG